jgi:hypothetical protein
MPPPIRSLPIIREGEKPTWHDKAAGTVVVPTA